MLTTIQIFFKDRNTSSKYRLKMQDDFFLKFHFKNRVKLVAAKKRYKTVEIRLKRTYQRNEEKKLELLRLSNPKSFFRAYKRCKKEK